MARSAGISILKELGNCKQRNAKESRGRSRVDPSYNTILKLLIFNPTCACFLQEPFKVDSWGVSKKKHTINYTQDIAIPYMYTSPLHSRHLTPLGQLFQRNGRLVHGAKRLAAAAPLDESTHMEPANPMGFGGISVLHSPCGSPGFHVGRVSNPGG